MTGLGVTSAPVGTAAPLAGDETSISLDLGPNEPVAQPQPTLAPAPAPTTPQPAVAPPAVEAPAAPQQPAAQPAAAPAVASTVVAEATTVAAAAVSAAGVPETEAVTAATREIIERVVWEVVPELAETLIRKKIQHLLTKHT